MALVGPNYLFQGFVILKNTSTYQILDKEVIKFSNTRTRNLV